MSSKQCAKKGGNEQKRKNRSEIHDSLSWIVLTFLYNLGAFLKKFRGPPIDKHLQLRHLGGQRRFLCFPELLSPAGNRDF